MSFTDTVLFGKYQIRGILGAGRAGTVFLARHMELDEFRAIKRVPKTYVDYQRFKQEALILKELRHPGIPVVYDLEEDSRYSYLIEEYLEGESFYDLIQSQGHLTAAMTVHYGIQICRLVNYLHSAGEIPILYLDLQPKNLLLCHETVKLVDFDHSATIFQANASSTRYGTVGCAAPEQYEPYGILDERTDIYAIGVILTYLGTGKYPDQSPAYGACGFSRELRNIAETCLQADPKKRYRSAEEAGLKLEQLEKRRGGVCQFLQKNQLSSLTIALAGSKPGVGTTHIAIGLSAYLWHSGYPNLYEEINDSGALWRMGLYFGARADRFGLMRIRGCRMKPGYGEAVRLEETGYRIRICDYGSDVLRLAECGRADFIFLVCDGSYWEADRAERAAAAVRNPDGLRIIFNHTCPGIRLRETEHVRKEISYRMPYQPDPFLPGKAQKKFYRELLKSAGIRTGGGALLKSLDGIAPALWERLGTGR